MKNHFELFDANLPFLVSSSYLSRRQSSAHKRSFKAIRLSVIVASCLMLGAMSSACIVGVMTSASAWTVFWAGMAGFSLGAGLALGLALAPLLCNNPNDVAMTSAAAFAIAYGYAMLVSFLSGVAWDLAGNVNAVLIPILLGSFTIQIAVPRFARQKER